MALISQVTDTRGLRRKDVGTEKIYSVKFIRRRYEGADPIRNIKMYAGLVGEKWGESLTPRTRSKEGGKRDVRRRMLSPLSHAQFRRKMSSTISSNTHPACWQVIYAWIIPPKLAGLYEAGLSARKMRAPDGSISALRPTDFLDEISFRRSSWLSSFAS